MYKKYVSTYLLSVELSEVLQVVDFSPKSSFSWFCVYQIGQVWTYLDKFEQMKTNLSLNLDSIKLKSSLVKFDKFGQQN